VSIGETLAAGRRQSGLTITQVSQRTCIRETIIRGIERGDFSGCGGDFYARGHIRSIARVIGLDPGPLIDEYDATMGAPEAISAAEVFQPVTPVKLKERRRPNWTAAMSVAVIAIGGIFAYQHFAGPAGPVPPAAAKPPAVPHRTQLEAGRAKRAGHPAAARHGHRRLDISLTATQNCWVQLTSATGTTIFSGVIYAGASVHWIEQHAVTLVVGNPAAVRLRVNGRNPIPPGSVTTVTLALRPRRA